MLGFGWGCAKPDAHASAPPVPVHVQVGILADDLPESAASPPDSVPERIERLQDRFWRAGCVGDDLGQLHADRAPFPDVRCRLPGTSTDTVVIAARVAPIEDPIGSWSGPHMLPSLYESMKVAGRAHSFVFIGLGRDAKHGIASAVLQIEPADRVRAIVELGRFEVGEATLLAASSDAGLLRDLRTVHLSLGLPREALRIYQRPEPATPLRGDDAIPSIAVASAAHNDSRGEREGEDADAAGASTYRSDARVIAAFLAYLDESLSARSESGSREPGDADAP